MDQQRLSNKTNSNSHRLCINYDVTMIVKILSDLLKKASQSVKDKYKIKIREKTIERTKEIIICVE